MLDKDLEQTLNDAFRNARDKRYEFVTVEHLLLALAGEPGRNQGVASLRRGHG